MPIRRHRVIAHKLWCCTFFIRLDVEPSKYRTNIYHKEHENVCHHHISVSVKRRSDSFITREIDLYCGNLFRSVILRSRSFILICDVAGWHLRSVHFRDEWNLLIFINLGHMKQGCWQRFNFSRSQWNHNWIRSALIRSSMQSFFRWRQVSSTSMVHSFAKSLWKAVANPFIRTLRNTNKPLEWLRVMSKSFPEHTYLKVMRKSFKLRHKYGK